MVIVRHRSAGRTGRGTGIGIDSRDGTLWASGRSPDRIYKSTDRGASWSSAGLAFPAGQNALESIAVDPGSGAIVQPTPTFTATHTATFTPTHTVPTPTFTATFTYTPTHTVPTHTHTDTFTPTHTETTPPRATGIYANRIRIGTADTARMLYATFQYDRDPSFSSPTEVYDLNRSNDHDVSWNPTDGTWYISCLLYTSPSPRDRQKSRMPSSA